MTLSSTKFAAKKSTTAAKAKPTKPAVDKPFIDPVVEEAMASYQAAQDNLLGTFNVPSGTRLLCAAVVGIVAYASSVWFTVPIVEAITIACLSLTGWAFLSYLVWVLGIFAVFISSMVAGWQAAKFVATVDFGRIADTGRALREATKKRISLVRGYFKRDAEPVAA